MTGLILRAACSDRCAGTPRYLSKQRETPLKEGQEQETQTIRLVLWPEADGTSKAKSAAANASHAKAPGMTRRISNALFGDAFTQIENPALAEVTCQVALAYP